MHEKSWAYEDLQVGREIAFAPRRVSAEEMTGFAREFDPQPMHLDEEAGRQTVLGGMSASGFFTICTLMRMMCDAYVLDSTSQGAPGVDHVHFRKPVFADDVLSGRSVVVDRRPSASRPGIGLVTMRHELYNQKNELVCELSNTGMFRMRAPEAA
jgi:acyl dehydratase